MPEVLALAVELRETGFVPEADMGNEEGRAFVAPGRRLKTCPRRSLPSR